MCGIAGVIADTQAGDIYQMTDALTHRGPNGAGFFLSKVAQLGHRRLIVVDPDTGQQPMTTLDGRFTIVFNGEIYNYRELRHELENQATRFRTRCDSEVLLEAYAHWGKSALMKLQGMFAFAVWDERERRLFAARDRLGVKPFYFAQAGEALLFGSEMKALLANSSVKRELDPIALDDFLTYLYVPAPRTIFRYIQELPPAHWLEWEAGQCRTGKYWDIPFRPEKANFAGCVEEFRERLQQAVKARLVSDVPLGVFLSGGLDSSTIASIVARNSSRRVQTYTIGFSDRAYDERSYSRQLNLAIGASAHEWEVPLPSTQWLAEVTRHFDEPFGNPTSLLIYQLSKMARRDITVALTGDGGDEALLGYPRYLGALLAQQYCRAPKVARQIVARLARHVSDSSHGRHFKRRMREFLTAGSLAPEQMYSDWVSYFGCKLRRSLYTPDLHAQIGDHESSCFLASLFRESDAVDLLDRISYVDLRSFLPYNLLRYCDRMSMAHGLEIRCPYTDHKMIEFLARVPRQYKLNLSEDKCLPRAAAQQWLPKTILQRKKAGLNPPMGAWLRGILQPLLQTHLAPKLIRDRGYFRPEMVQRLIADHLSGHRDYALHLWALISFEEWHRQYLNSTSRHATRVGESSCPILRHV